MIFRKDYGTLVKKSLQNLVVRSNITNTTVGGIARSLIEVINLNISEYYDILDINTAMGFVSTAEGYFLDLIGDLFGMTRLLATVSTATSSDNTQLFYVATGTLHDRIPTDIIPQNTQVSTEDGSIIFTVSADAPFGITATQVYVSVEATGAGSNYNVGVNTLTKHSLGLSDVFTTNERVIIGGSDTESDSNFRYRIINASLSAEKANETAIRLAALSVAGVADVKIRPYARGIGSYDVMVIPVEGLATQGMLNGVQSAIDSVQAFGITGTAIKPSVVPVEIEVRLIYVNNTTDTDRTAISESAKTAIEKYIVNIPPGGTFILNELRQQIMDVSTKILDHVINCYYFRQEPTFMGNVSIYWDEMFYPDTSIAEAIRVL